MAENQTDKPSQHAKKKTSPLKVALILSALVLALLLLKLVLLLTAKPTISVDYVAEFNRISRPADYDPNQNAATYYQKAFDALTKMTADRQDIWRVLPADMNEAQIQFLESWLESNSQAINYLNQAIQKRYHWVQARSENNSLGHIDLSYLADFRQAAYCLKFQSKLYAATHEIQQAIESAMHLKQMSLHLDESKMLIAQLLAIAIDGLATQAAFQILDSTVIDSKTLAHFQSQFERVPQPEIANSFPAEKLSTYDAVQRVFTDDGTGDGRLIPHKLFTYRGYPNILRGTVSEPRFYSTIPIIYLKTIWASLNHPTKRETLKLVEEVYQLLDQLAGKTPWQMSQQGTSYDQQLQNLTHDNYFVTSRFAGRGRTCQIYHRCIATNDALITTIAILRYKTDNDQLPENLDQLVADGYIKQLPPDPFGPGPLTYKRIGNDFKLYSFGIDLDDDDGTGYSWGHGEEGGDQLFWPIKRPEKNQNP